MSRFVIYPAWGSLRKLASAGFFFFIIKLLSSLPTAGYCPTPKVPYSLGFYPIPLFGWSQRRLPRLRPVHTLVTQCCHACQGCPSCHMIVSPRRSFQADPPTPLRAHLFCMVSKGLQHINPNDSDSPPDSFNIRTPALLLCLLAGSSFYLLFCEPCAFLTEHQICKGRQRPR